MSRKPNSTRTCAVCGRKRRCILCSKPHLRENHATHICSGSVVKDCMQLYLDSLKGKGTIPMIWP